MKPIIPTTIFLAVITSTLATPIDIPLNVSTPFTSNLPPSTFKIRTSISAPLLPIDAALMNVLYFLGITSLRHPTEELPPHTHTAPGYRQVEISSFAWTETRFLLWGIYLAVVDMVRTARFHDMVVNLYWEGKMVGRMRIAVKKSFLGLSGGGDHQGRVLEDSSEFPSNRSMTEHSTNLLSLWQPFNSSGPASTTTSPFTAPLTAMDITITFQPVASATDLTRNEVFLTFFTALLHVARFNPNQEMSTFDSKSPLEDVHVYMYRSGASCQYGRAINILTYVPKYMLENPDFGYKETQFQAKVFGLEACKGTLLKSLLP